MQDDLSTLEGPLLSRDELTLEADVLVLGGGPAGTWAAWTAASAGARVVLADKGYCPTNALFVAPDADQAVSVSEQRLSEEGLLGSYREAVGWNGSKAPGAQRDRSFVLLPLATPSRSPATST